MCQLNTGADVTCHTGTDMCRAIQVKRVVQVKPDCASGCNPTAESSVTQTFRATSNRFEYSIPEHPSRPFPDQNVWEHSGGLVVWATN